MTREWDFAEAVAAQGVIGIVRAKDPATAAEDAGALIDAGLHAVEVSLTTPDALQVIRDLAAANPDIWVGAGTVLDEVAVVAAVDAGARFLVAPHTTEATIRAARRRGVPIVPGAATPTEALRALEVGATMVKLFPASLYGPSVVRDMLAALPQVPLVPTGGVTRETAQDYLSAGATAVGMGSGLTRGPAGDPTTDAAALLKTLRGGA